MSLVDTIKDGMVILDLKDNSPVVFVSELTNLALCPVEPVMLSTLLSIHMLKLYVIELALEVVFDKGCDQIKVTLDLTVNFYLLKSFVGVRVTLVVVVAMMVVVMMVAH